ncbi:helix-turn-helix domain-containing protein [Actinoplanes teichomyceticus]|uniref:helix-turn-helix domain-containing protein n=1 Tax=Actinoplanes teichomyceticus TaxID=1867 RepID=UPI001A440FDD|nr:MerR family transcriptional regulator [Actinoplanes teichomyceticus]GIF15641.1 hypothetical protein Ate01nite_56730 [Actinoplanes teichomyceticus]
MWTMEELVDRVRIALAAEYSGAPNGRVRDLPDRRSIRWYSTIGLVDRPLGMRGRNALYGPRHLLQLVAIKRLQAAGRTLAEIQAELAGTSEEALSEVARVPSVLLNSEPPPPPPADRPPFWKAAPATSGSTDLTADWSFPAPAPAAAGGAGASAPPPGISRRAGQKSRTGAPPAMPGEPAASSPSAAPPGPSSGAAFPVPPGPPSGAASPAPPGPPSGAASTPPSGTQSGPPSGARSGPPSGAPSTPRSDEPSGAPSGRPSGFPARPRGDDSPAGLPGAGCPSSPTEGGSLPSGPLGNGDPSSRSRGSAGFHAESPEVGGFAPAPPGTGAILSGTPDVPPPPSDPPGGWPAAGTGGVLTGLPLGAGVILLVPGAAHLDHIDRTELATAARPLLDLLASRGLTDRRDS